MHQLTDMRDALRGLALAIIAALVAACTCLPARADAPLTGSDPIIEAIPSEFQLRVEQTAAEYDFAVAQRDSLEWEVLECQATLADLEAQLPIAQDRAADAIREQYKLEQGNNGLIELLISAEDFNDFISVMQYMTSVTQHHSNQIEELLAITAQVQEQRAALESALEQARVQEQVAADALYEAQLARAEAQRQAHEAALAEQARLAAEAAALAAAEQAAQQQTAEQAQEGTETPTNPGTTGDAGQQEAEEPSAPAEPAVPEEPAVEDPAPEEPPYEEPVPDEPPYEEPYIEDPVPEEPVYEDPVDWMTDRDIFIAEWGARINAYTYGFPLGGYGEVFAAAAWDYGVDPRFSPAIAMIESTLGMYCFMPCNAWGWGHVAWGSWEEAIYDHVAGLARGYGYTVTWEGACKYCPPTAWDWYVGVSGQMELI